MIVPAEKDLNLKGKPSGLPFCFSKTPAMRSCGARPHGATLEGENYGG
jgi:hypothetical protein